MTKEVNISQAISQGITFLAAQQEKNGSFLSLSSSDSDTFKSAIAYHSTFSTALILDILNNLPSTSPVIKIKNTAATFLLRQKSQHWSFNYWDRNSEESKTMPYPDDLDDTFCALAALQRFDPSNIKGQAMAQIVRILTALEAQEGGPYRTWLVNEKSNTKWKDVDIAVNSNIAYFLSLNSISLPKLSAFIEKCIAKEKLTSPYYPTIYPIIYFISRFYKGKYNEKLQELLLSKKRTNHTWGNPLQTALAISSLLNFGIDPTQLEKSIDSLYKTRINESWQPYGFCIDPAIEGKIYYSGSSALTTAFCLEALHKYLQVYQTSEKKDGNEAEKLNQAILQNVTELFSPFGREFQKRALSLCDKLIINDTSRQIPLLPYYFSQTLGGKKKQITDQLLTQLGTANVLGWIAYTIYDDFLDDEGDPNMLSVANASLRELTSIFENIKPEAVEFRAFFHTIMDQLDEANTWEVTQCRLPIRDDIIETKNIKIPHYGKYERLAYKSLGHAMGPLTILFFLGYKWNSKEMKSLMAFFQHYLIAKQLNDDAHDWEEDFKKGHVNPVGALLLKKIYLTHIKGTDRVSLPDLIPLLRTLFWDEILDKVCQTIYKHIQEAKEELGKCKAIENPGPLLALINKYETAAKKAADEKKQVKEFLTSYKVQ